MIRSAKAALALLGFVVVGAAAMRTATSSSSPPGDRLTAHEWGTFTSIAGVDGRAIEWLPLGGPTDLPCFVEHFQGNPTIKIIPTDNAVAIDYETARSKLWGKVRMETPVLYFYGPTETAVDVAVQFPRGLITEYYPHAVVLHPQVTATALHSAVFTSSVVWKGVTVGPAAGRAFPMEAGESHYYAARKTDAATLGVGQQRERFLFYRGVANFDVALSAIPVASGVTIRNLGSEEIPNVVLFERHGATVGYRIGGPLRGEMTLATPSSASTVEALRADLEKMLITAGLYPKEAAAMLETWRDTWFEDGTRVFYILPQAGVDRILPLQVKPAPATTARVFVGRMEVVTPEVQATVQSAITNNDAGVLARYARFLEPITERILATTTDASTRDRIRSVTSAAYARYVARSTACE